MQIQVKQSYKGQNISSLYRFPFVYSKRPNIGPADYWSLTLAREKPDLCIRRGGAHAVRTTSHFCRQTCNVTREDTPSTYTAIGKVTTRRCVSPGKLPLLMTSPLTQHSWGQSRMVRTQSNGAQLYWLETRLSCTSWIWVHK